MNRYPLILLILLITTSSFAQRRVKLNHADTLKGSIRNGERFDRLIGNVVFTQNTTTIYCDSAHFFKTQNRIEAFGQVHITDGDSVDVTSKSLTYDGNEKIAFLRKKVVFTKLGIATLYTDFLDYDRQKNEARYFNGGKLVDTTNVLTSKKGYYDVRTNLAAFKTEVVGVNPDYTMTSDTLQYNSKTKVIYFKDETTIKDKEGGTAVYKNGFYNTNRKLSTLSIGQIETTEYKIKGDEYFIDDVKKFYKAKGSVVMTSKEDNMLIFGDDSFYNKKTGVSKVYGHAYVAQIDDQLDTLFIGADTLVSIENKDPRKKRLLAYNHVKIFKKDLQGIADSLVYLAVDSTIYFYTTPALWSSGNQMTADSIHIRLKNKTIDKLFMVGNSFVVSQDSLTNFNQIKGRNMTTTFKGNDINYVLVEGNAESIYYALEEKIVDLDSMKAKLTITMGMNKMICSKMKIIFEDGKVNTVNAYVRPDAKFIPPPEIKEADRTLKGFVWKADQRPTRDQVVKKSGNEIKDEKIVKDP
jgi:lipopolysaccharide export system protein LptA